MKKVWRYEVERGRFFFAAKLCFEPWFFTLANGLRAVHLFRLGWIEKPGVPGVRIYQATLLWLSLQVSF
ncbi:hypothetical protein [Zoogloea sp.]|uniref:hypothetical protein n=1 Tax=Zoogloea sp. TaxID=49181 RepID=UPI00263689DD|nr:hypothetical protein [Zoogloea sp.]